MYLNQLKTQKEIADIYGCAIPTIFYYLSKYHISGLDLKDKKKLMEKRWINKYKKIGLTKQRIEELYYNKEKPLSIIQIAKLYDLSEPTIYKIADYYKIKRKEPWQRQKRTPKEAQQSLFQKNLERIKKEVDKNSLNQIRACKLISCDFGIKELEKLCLRQDLNFKILSEVYRKLEKILFKLNLYRNFKIKSALSIYLKFNVSQGQASRLTGCYTTKVRDLYELIKPYIRVTNKLPYIPDKPINISKIFQKSKRYLLEFICPNCGFKYETILTKSFSISLNPFECPSCNHKNLISFSDFNFHLQNFSLKEERRCK